RRHTRSYGDWSSDVCSSDLNRANLTTHQKVKVHGVDCASAFRIGPENMPNTDTWRCAPPRLPPPARTVLRGFCGLNVLLLSGFPDRKSTRLNSSHRTISYAV